LYVPLRNGYDVASHSYCQFVSFALAWCVICLVLRITSIVLASRICCGCFGGAREPAAVAMVAMPVGTSAAPAGVPAAGVPYYPDAK
jgi:hypothetical protein